MKLKNIVNEIASFKKAALIWKTIGDKPFYAIDFNLNGGVINGLAHYGFIKPTGNTKESFILIDEWHEYYKKVSVKEWQINIFELNKFVNDIEELSNQIQEMI